MSKENVEIVRRMYEAFHAGDAEGTLSYFEMWDDFEDELLELLEVGDKVVSVVTSRGRGRSSGVVIEWVGNAGVWTIRGGKVIRVVWFTERDEALEAAGLSE